MISVIITIWSDISYSLLLCIFVDCSPNLVTTKSWKRTWSSFVTAFYSFLNIILRNVILIIPFLSCILFQYIIIIVFKLIELLIDV